MEIKKLEIRIKKLNETKLVNDQTKGSNPEFPYQPVTIHIQGFEDSSEKINKLEQVLKERLEIATELKLKIERWILSIEDSRTRLVFEMRYMDNKSWIQISRKLGSCNESYARMIHDRFLKLN